MKKDYKKSSLKSLRCKIAGIGESIRFAKRHDRKTKDKGFISWQWMKLSHSRDARILNLAFGLLRGIPYKKMESKVSEQNGLLEYYNKPILEKLLEQINKEIFSTKDKWTIEELKKEIQS